MSEKTAITLKESARLVELERTIKDGLMTFMEVGRALIEIRDAQLYRIQHRTFEAYCRDQWGMTDRHARNLIAASSTASSLAGTGTIVPKTESQARPLTKLPPAEQPEAWARAVEIAGGDQPTAKQVERAVQAVRSAKRSKPKKKTRGSYKNWQAFRDICAEIAERCESLAALKVDAMHEIRARDLCAKLAKKLTRIGQRQ